MKTSKKLFAALLFGCIAMPTMATEVSDTLVIEDANKVRIETRDTVQRIVISGMKKDPDFHYVQRISIPDTSAVRRSVRNIHDFNKIILQKKGKDSKWDHSWHFNIGLNAMLDTPDEYDFKVWPSFEVGFGITHDWHPYGKQNQWSIGWGLNWRGYNMADDTHWTKVGDMMTLTDYAPGQTETQTSLQTFSLQVPLLYTHYFDKDQDWGITLGAIVNWNVFAVGQREYEFLGEEYEVTTKKIGQRPFTVEGMVQLHTSWLPSIYCKYCPMTFFKDDRGPKMHQLTFGICL